MGKGGSEGTNSTVSQTTTTLPDWVEPYQLDLLDRAAYQTSLPYQTYQGQRVADFSPNEQEAMARQTEVGMSGTNPALTEASRLAYNVGNDQFLGVNTGITSGYNASALNGAGNYSPTSRQSGYNPQYRSSGYQAGNYSGLGGSGGGGYSAGQRQVGYEPGRLDDGAMLNNYMSPYMQQVVDVEKREARRQGDITNQNIGLSAAQQGGLGGYRDAIMRSENNRNTGQLMGDIQTQGQQAAFADAKASFEADRSARGQLEQFGQSQFGMNEQMRQTVEQLMQSGYSMEQATKQAQEQFGQSQFGMNSSNRQAQEQFGQSQFGMNSQNQQFGSQMGLQQYQAYEQARQQAAAMGMTAQQANQAAQIALMNGQLGYQQNQLGASAQLAGFAQQQQAMELERLGLLQGVGSAQRQLAQSGLDSGYQNFLNQQSYPYEMLSFFNNLMQGGAMTPGSTTALFGPQPSGTQQGLGAGIAALGLSGIGGGG